MNRGPKVKCPPQRPGRPAPSYVASKPKGDWLLNTFIVLLAFLTAGAFYYRWHAAKQQTVVEDEPEQVVVVEDALPAQEMVPKATPVPVQEVAVATIIPPKENALDWLRDRKERWPAEVQMTQEAVFPAKYRGKDVGSVKVSVGTFVLLMSIQGDTAIVAYGGGTNRVPIAATDLEARAKLEMAKPTPPSATVIASSAPPVPAVSSGKPKSAAQVAADEEWQKQFQAGKAPLGQRAEPSTASRNTGRMTYALQQPKEPTEDEKKIFGAIKAGMDQAINFYNRNTTLKKQLNIQYSPGTPTADGNINGTIRLGRNARNARVCMHEIGHTVGIGTHPNWGKLMVDHRWQGKHGNKVLQELTHDSKAEIHGDHMHFWPYGLNYDNEVKSDKDLIGHAKIVEAMVKDLEDAH